MRPDVLGALRELTNAIVRGEMGGQIGLKPVSKKFSEEQKKLRDVIKKQRFWIAAQ